MFSNTLALSSLSGDQQQLVLAVFNGHNVMADWQHFLFAGLQSEDQEERICAFASSLKGAEPVSTNELRGEVQENGTIRCSRGSRCYGLWERLADGEMQLLNQGQERFSIQSLNQKLWSKLCSG